MSRLWVRLTLAFALVVLVTVSAITALADLTASREFHRYLSYSDTSRDLPLVDDLASYYQEQASWQGVEKILGEVPAVVGPQRGLVWRMRPGMIVPRDSKVQIVLADAGGTVVYDNSGGRSGRELTGDEAAASREIVVDGEVVGRLVVSLPMHLARLGPLEQGFLAELRRWLVIGVPLALAVGLLLGLVFSRTLTAPLQRLAAAARVVATGDFSHRVAVEGSAEVAEVSQAFNEMSAALEQAERQRQNLVADVAHELRTPLSVLQGNLRAILDDVYPLDKAEISRLHDQTLLLSRLVDDLRELALVDAGRLHLNLQATNVVQVVRTTTESMSQGAKDQEVSLTVQIPDDLPVVQADPDRIAQVLHNLLVNAFRHTPSGGSVTVQASATGDAVEIAVADTGEGIAQEDLPHIFDRFWRADRSRARDGRRSGGAGLGLSIAKSLVEAHGGRIWAESTSGGEGATFRFTLPLQKSGVEGDAT